VAEDRSNVRALLDEHRASNTREPLTHVETEFARELFEQHRLSLYRYLKHVLLSKDDAQEVLQETYLRLLRQPSFDRIRQNARAYLFQIASNLATDLFRRRSAKTTQAEAEMFTASGLDTPDWATWPELALEGEQIEALLIAALEDLAPAVRTALLLHRFQDLTHQEIALRMSLSARTIERYIKEGLSQIANWLEANL
jgi:RNA polymerase sigma factor (sigma-70 family)